MLTLHFDGSCYPTNTAAYGAFILRDGDTVLKEDSFLEKEFGTNNIAEFAGLVAGLRYARFHHPKSGIHIFGDSQLVIRQLTGQYACKKDHLIPYLAEAHRLLEGIQWKAEWIRRNKNTDADKLSKKR